MKPLAKAIALTENRKLGVAATTHAAQQSCPSVCVFKDGGGCYAERGPQGAFVTAHVNRAAAEQQATALDVAHAEALAIDEMQTIRQHPMRLHTVGDCASDEAALLVSAAAERYMDRGGGSVWTYTHAWRDVARESWGRVSVLASCETAAEVAQARARGYATALVVQKFPGKVLYGEEGAKILPCPSQTVHTTCSECRLCFNDAGLIERGYSIGFEVHGDRVTRERAASSLWAANLTTKEAV